MTETMYFVYMVVLPVLSGCSAGLAAYQVLSGASPAASAMNIGVAVIVTIISVRPLVSRTR